MRRLKINKGRTVEMSEAEFRKWVKTKKLYSKDSYVSSFHDSFIFGRTGKIDLWRVQDTMYFSGNVKLKKEYRDKLYRPGPGRKGSNVYEDETIGGKNIWDLVWWKVKVNRGKFYVTKVLPRSY